MYQWYESSKGVLLWYAPGTSFSLYFIFLHCLRVHVLHSLFWLCSPQTLTNTSYSNLFLLIRDDYLLRWYYLSPCSPDSSSFFIVPQYSINWSVLILQYNKYCAHVICNLKLELHNCSWSSLSLSAQLNQPCWHLFAYKRPCHPHLFADKRLCLVFISLPIRDCVCHLDSTSFPLPVLILLLSRYWRVELDATHILNTLMKALQASFSVGLRG